MEQLNAGFLESDVVDYLKFEPNIFTCPWTERVN